MQKKPEGKHTILIIDDDANLRKTLADILRMKGYEAHAARNGAEGLSFLTLAPIHVALIDLRLKATGCSRTSAECSKNC